MNVEWKSHGFLHPFLSDLLAPWIKESWDGDGVKLYAVKNHGGPLLFKDLY
jgi:hypothetical protein